MNKKIVNLFKAVGFTLLLLPVFAIGEKAVSAQTSPSVLYVPLIGITSVPEPLVLPNGPGKVTYNYAVKNFLQELPLTNVRVADDKCGSVNFVGGDDNNDSKLDFNETWRYSCSIKLDATTQSIATASGSANNIAASHDAYATVVVGSILPAPLVSIVNVTKIASPLSFPEDGSYVTFTYKVNNPGLLPLSQVSVTDDKCSSMSGKLGDTNNNSLLDINEVWIYNCSALLKETTTSTASVTAFANGLKAVDYASLNIKVSQAALNLFDLQISPGPAISHDLKNTVWGILAAILAALIIFYFFSRKDGLKKTPEKPDPLLIGRPR